MPILIETLDNLLIPCNPYFIRIQKYPNYEDIIKSFETADNIISCLAVEHYGKKNENPHYHLCLMSLQKPQALRKWLKTRFTEDSGNAHMSLKPWDRAELQLQYCFHEKDAPVILQKGYSDSYILKLRAKALVFENNKKTYGSKIEEKTLQLIAEDGEPSQNQVEHQYITYKIWDACKEESFNYPNKYLLDRIICSVQANLTNGPQAVVTFEEMKKTWYAKMYQLDRY